MSFHQYIQRRLTLRNKKFVSLEFAFCFNLDWYFKYTYRKIPKISPGVYIFQRPLFIFGGAYIRRGLSTEGNLRFKIDWASLIVGSKFTVLLCIWGQFSKFNHRGAYIWRGLYMEGLIFRILRYSFSWLHMNTTTDTDPILSSQVHKPLLFIFQWSSPSFMNRS